MTENAREWHEHLREEDAINAIRVNSLEMATIMSLFSENWMACYTAKNPQIRLLCGSP